MIRRIFLVARQEFVKYVTRRGFFISLVMFPVILIVATAVPTFIASHPKTTMIAVVDQTGGYEQVLADAAARDRAEDQLSALADYAREYADMKAVTRADPELAAMIENHNRVASIKAFMAQGGWRTVFAALDKHLKPDAPAFTPRPPHYVVIAAPPDLAADVTDGNGKLALGYLTGARGPHISAVVVIPKGFGPGSSTAAQYWTVDSEKSTHFVRSALTNALRLRTLQELVPPDEKAHVTLDVDAAVHTVDPTRGAKERVSLVDKLAQFVPMGLAFLLFIVAFSDSALLLQGVVEEKSTRMIEVLLSCASPQEIMTGKLFGVVGLALLTVAVWSVSLIAIALYFSSQTAAVLAEGLSSLMPLLPLIVLYFFCGLLIYSAIFLGIGATTSSLPDAQALLGPATMIIILPNMLMGVLIQDPNGTLATIISWIPIYTPFFMLVRLPFHPPPAELWATAALVVLTTILFVRQVGRIFARNVLTTERPPSFGKLVGQLFGRRKPA